MTQEVAGLRKGDRVELVAVPAGKEGQDYAKYGVIAGCRGEVDFIDSLRTVHIEWDIGGRLGVLAEHRNLIRRTRQVG